MSLCHMLPFMAEALFDMCSNTCLREGAHSSKPLGETFWTCCNKTVRLDVKEPNFDTKTPMLWSSLVVFIAPSHALVMEAKAMLSCADRCWIMWVLRMINLAPAQDSNARASDVGGVSWRVARAARTSDGQGAWKERGSCSARTAGVKVSMAWACGLRRSARFRRPSS